MIEYMTDCHLCQIYLAGGWHLIKDMCASYAALYGHSIEEEMALHISWYHANNHVNNVEQSLPGR